MPAPFRLTPEQEEEKKIIENQYYKQRIEAQELRSKYIDGLVKEGILKSLISDYLNGCSYYYNTQTKEIVSVSVFDNTFPFTPTVIEGHEKAHIIELNLRLIRNDG